VIYERSASVFRFDPTGKTWECIGAGGRNPPSLGMNYLGEFFSFDSDMEWHVDLPWYRPVRLNHWATGGDQGWQGVGAYPSYYLDCLPGVLNVGRGSPNWGIFYEHTQFPEKYHNHGPRFWGWGFPTGSPKAGPTSSNIASRSSSANGI
jgi:hypothetical protein